MKWPVRAATSCRRCSAIAKSVRSSASAPGADSSHTARHAAIHRRGFGDCAAWRLLRSRRKVGGGEQGVAPDIDVENTPKEAIAGHDPQLERAVDEAMKQLADNPVFAP